MANTVKDSIATRKIAILAADGVNEDNLLAVKEAITAEGALCECDCSQARFYFG